MTTPGTSPLADPRLDVERVYFFVADRPEHWPRLASAALRAAETPWSEYVRIPESPADLEWFGAYLDFQPFPRIAELGIPVFYAWGFDDRVTPPEMNPEVVWTGMNQEFLADLWAWLAQRGVGRPTPATR